MPCSQCWFSLFCQSWWDAQFFLMAATNFQIGESKMISWRVRAFDELLFSELSMSNIDIYCTFEFRCLFSQSFQMREWPTVWSFWFMESLGSSESPLRFCFSASTELTRGRGKSHCYNTLQFNALQYKLVFVIFWYPFLFPIH